MTQTPTPATSTMDVEAGFDAAASRYDLLVALNPGYHRHLRLAARAFARGMRRVPGAARDAGRVVLDIGCGSGASTRALDGQVGDARILGIDASEGMLRQARAKSWRPGVEFVHADARHLRDVLQQREMGRVDGIFAAYLLRNVPEGQRDDVLASFADALTDGGVFVTQEYSVAGRRAARAVWSAVCWGVVVPLAVVVRGNPDLYRYLWRSVVDFDSTDRLEGRLRAAGFEHVKTTTVDGWQRGILHTVTAVKAPRVGR